jgi:2-methylcitrate dehydratase PrpD
VAVDKSMHEDQVHVTIKLKNGKTLEKYVEHCVGSLGRPMSDADLEAKFRAFCPGILAKGEADKLIRLCWDIGKLDDAAEVARASVPAARAAKRAGSKAKAKAKPKVKARGR